LENNIRIIDDSYNSNPAALSLALESLAKLPGERKVVVLGDMLELGEQEKDFHIQAGKEVVKLGLGLLLAVGSLGHFIATGALSAGMNPENILSFSASHAAAEERESL